MSALEEIIADSSQRCCKRLVVATLFGAEAGVAESDMERIWEECQGVVLSYAAWNLVINGELAVEWDEDEECCRFRRPHGDEIAARKEALARMEREAAGAKP